jgi:hypothetical protein
MPSSFVLTMDIGETLDRLLTIANVGSADLTWTLAEQPAVGWLSASSLGETLAPSESDEVTVSFDATGLTTGTHTTTLVIGSDDPNEDPVEVPVELTVGAFPDIEVTPASIDVMLEVGQAAERTLTVGNVGSADLIWGLEDPGVSWLSASPTGGTVGDAGSEDVTLSLDAAGLAYGETYTKTLVINSDDPNENPVQVPLSLTVTCRPAEIQDVMSNSPVRIGETMYFTATVTGTEPYSYTWDFGGAGSGPGSGLTTRTPTWTYIAVDTYAVTLTATNPCHTDVYTFDVRVEEQEIYLPIVARSYAP